MADKRVKVGYDMLNLAWFYVRKNMRGLPESDKEDFVMDACYKYWKGTKNKDEFQSTLMFLICRHIRYNMVNRTARVYQKLLNTVPAEDAYWISSGEDVHSCVEGRDIWDAVEAMDDNRDKIRSILLHSQGYSCKEIGEMTGVKEASVYKRMDSGLKQIRKELNIE